MGKRLKERDIVLDLILSSPARRALSTAKKIGEILQYAEARIKTDENLYHASEDEILAVVRQLPDKQNNVMIVGHNPGLTDFVNSIMNLTLFNIPTCGVAACTFDVSSWKEIKWGSGTNLFYDFPKSKED